MPVKVKFYSSKGQVEGWLAKNLTEIIYDN